MLEKANLLGAIVAVSLYSLYILLFVFRLLGRVQFGHWLASLQFFSVIPLVYLLLKAPQLGRPVLYYVQIGLMLVFLLVELLLDYIYMVDFRQVRWMVISYVMLFFAATGGLLGVAAYAGRTWMVAAVILFLIMAVLAFVQRALTGM
ncbi:MAG: hypothetical protein KAS36_07980 [Anaerolineales bacterium]|nr:hypothetical protein [Anaerolineales bacterium]